MPFDLKRFEEDLRHLVNIDSGSTCIEGVNTVTDWFTERFEALGWKTMTRQPEPDAYGRSSFAWLGDPMNLDLLVISHTDTVFPAGTADERPFSIEGNRYRGPGVADMKAGCLMALQTFEQLTQEDRLKGNIGIIFNGEHELSCPTIRPFLEEWSRRSKVVVTTEPARANGSCVRQRKGILRYHLRFHGISAHSGVEPEKGHCAVTEMARFILALKEKEDLSRGISVNPGIVSGGHSVNAIPSLAECRLDVRVIEAEDAPMMDAAIRELARQTTDSQVRIELTGGITRPPLTPNARSEEIIQAMNQIASRYGIDLSWGFSGGGSDASFASAFGIPALCALGPVGGGYHTDQEYVEIEGIEARLCLFRDSVEALVNGSI